MSKAMISQPMANKTPEQIENQRRKAIAHLTRLGYEVVDTYFHDEFDNETAKNKGLLYLAKSLEKMADCDAVLFCDGWEHARGCRIEYQAAIKYDLDVLFVPIDIYESAT